MMKSWRISIAFFALAVVLGSVGIAFASQSSSTTAEEINGLKESIDEKQSHINDINNKIDDYKKKIAAAQMNVASLGNEVDLLDNRITKAELDIEVNNIEIDSTNEQLAVLDQRIGDYEAQLERERGLLSQVLQKMQNYDSDVGLQLLFGTDSFSELFDRLQSLESVNSDLVDTLNRAKDAKEQVRLARAEQEGKKQNLLALQDTLAAHKAELDEERGAKESLLAASENNETQFQSLLYDLRGEMAYIDNQVAALQGQIEAKLSEADQSGGSSLLSWPVNPSYRGISTKFHDPTYPFRNLFEHPGIDIPEPAGTPVGAAASGYVAWVRVGSQYGNYVMIIHSNGIATLYAHLSKVFVKQDQFVARGDEIALSGGVPGAPGAGLSTGAHLHFEVRKDGIPTDPMGYLISR